VALLVGSLTLLLTGCSVHQAELDMRWGWPSGVTKQAEEMRVLWTWAGVAALIVGIIVWGLIFWCCIRYRKKDDVLPRQTKYNLPVELVYSLTPFLIIGVLFWRTVVVEDNVNDINHKPEAVVRVDAFKWNWQFQYLSDKYGHKTVYTKDPKTPLSTVGSDNEIPVLVLPRNENVEIIEHSEDVIHSFWVPEFLFKRDVIPYGKDHDKQDNRFEIKPTKDGSFVGRCAELCGTYHSEMNFEVRVVEPSVFTKYLAALDKAGESNPARQSTALKAAGMAPYATTTYPFKTSRTSRAATHKPGRT
jgi:cytochrome c oxidase subunit 2